METPSQSPKALVEVSPPPKLFQKEQPVETVATKATSSRPYDPQQYDQCIKEFNAKLDELKHLTDSTSSSVHSSTAGFRFTRRSASLDNGKNARSRSRTEASQNQGEFQAGVKRRVKSLSLDEDRATSLQSLEPSTQPTLRLRDQVSKNLRKQDESSDQEGRLKTLKEINEKWLQETAPKPTR